MFSISTQNLKTATNYFMIQQFFHLNWVQRGCACSVSILLGGCLLNQEVIQPPEVEHPPKWEAPHIELSEELEDLRFPSWDFEETPVPDLVAEALDNSPFLRSSEALAEAAKANVALSISSKLPQVSFRTQGNRQMYNLGTSPSFGRLFGGSTFITNHYTTDAVASWELDLWGKLTDLENAAKASANAAMEDFENARLSIAAHTARAWIRLTTAHLQALLTQETVQSFEANLGIIQTRFEQGLASALDLRLTQASLTSSKAVLERQKREESEARRDLETLLGRYPSAKILPGDTLPLISGPIPAGIPANLLLQRPDLRAARNHVLAAGYRVREAGKGFLPGISLTGIAGTASQDLKNLTDWGFGSWSLVGNLSQPLFSGGRITARKEQTSALQKQAIAQFESLALEAFKEVENALDADQRLAREEEALGQAVKEFSEAENLAWERYQKGLIDIITPLEAQRRANEAKTRHLALQAQRVDNRIRLHLALATKLSLE